MTCLRISALVAVLLSTSVIVNAQTRPALIGNGPDALINRINTNRLAAKTNGGAIVMFDCYVDEKGRPRGGSNAPRFR